MPHSLDHGSHEGEASLMDAQPRGIDHSILAVLINFAVIMCNFATFWLITSHSSAALLTSMHIINNLFSVIGIGVGLGSLNVGWSSLQDPSNRITYSLFCAMSIIVAAATFG